MTSPPLCWCFGERLRRPATVARTHRSLDAAHCSKRKRRPSVVLTTGGERRQTFPKDDTFTPDSLTGQWRRGFLSVAAARGATRSELFRASSDMAPRGEWSLWLSLPHRPREVNRRVAGHVGPEKLCATLHRASAVPYAQRKRRGGCTRGSPQTGDAPDSACRARLGEGNG